MSFTARRLLLWSIVLCASAQPLRAGNSAALVRQIDLSRADGDVTRAELELEKWNLTQILSLREEGYASWLDVEQQRLVVRTLERECAAASTRTAFLQQLEQRAGHGKHENHGRRNVPPPMLVSLPGSIRLVGWLDPRHLSANLRTSDDLLIAAPSGEAVDRVKEARMAMRRADAQLEAWGEGSESRENSSMYERLERQRNLERARFARALLERDGRPLDSAGTRSTSDLPLVSNRGRRLSAESVGEITHCVVSAGDDALFGATLLVARAEAKATGRAAILRIEHEQIERRWAALAQLRREGHATIGELERASKAVETSQGLLDTLDAQQTQLVEAYQSLQSLADKLGQNGTPIRPIDASKQALPSAASWPARFLGETALVQHVAALYARAHARASDCDGLRWKADLLGERITRLKSAQQTMPTPAHGIDTPLEKTFAAANQREIRHLEQELKLVLARAKWAKQRHEVVVLETHRFLKQCLYQDGMRPGEADLAALRDREGRFSYLESYDPRILNQVCRLAFSTNDIKLVKFAYQPRGVPSTPPVQIEIDRTSTRFRPLDHYGSWNSIFGQVNACLRYGVNSRRICGPLDLHRARLNADKFTGHSPFDLRWQCREQPTLPRYLRGLRPGYDW